MVFGLFSIESFCHFLLDLIHQRAWKQKEDGLLCICHHRIIHFLADTNPGLQQYPLENVVV